MDLPIGRHTILVGDVRERLRDLPDDSVHCVVTSPPYFGLRDYGVSGQIGLEPTLAGYIATMVDVFREVRRVLRPDGTLWCNIGDSYAGSGPSGAGYQSETTKRRAELKQDGNFRLSKRLAAGDPGYDYKKPHVIPDGLKPKDLMMVPARLAIALQDDGWWLRSDIIWHKKAPMPESVTDRPTSAHEHIFLLAKNARYYYDADAVREDHITADRTGPRRSYEGTASSMNGDAHVSMTGPFAGLPLNPAGRNQRNVWTLGPEPFPEAHFATFPTEIPRRAIKAGTGERGVCAACGAPWVRQVEREPMVIARSERREQMGEFGRTQSSGTMVSPPKSTTTGWAPSCACDADVIPATCLDPFLGSGTTMLVADQLGRTCIGVELNPEYAAMAKKRVYDASPLQLLGAY